MSQKSNETWTSNEENLKERRLNCFIQYICKLFPRKTKSRQTLNTINENRGMENGDNVSEKINCIGSMRINNVRQLN